MKLKRTSIALALAGGLLLSGATFAAPERLSGSGEPVLITYEVYEPVVVRESGWVMAPSRSTSTAATYYYVEPAPRVVLVPETERYTYYLVPGTRDSQMPNPTPPSESRSWGG